MDFSALYEVFLEGRWFTFDARHNHPRIGRIVMREDATRPMSPFRRPSVRFNVITDELKDFGLQSSLKKAA
jgi:transglutaminase-like putative cysteine protease